MRNLDKSQGLITLGWVSLVMVSVIRPETPCDIGYITEDVSKFHQVYQPGVSTYVQVGQ